MPQNVLADLPIGELPLVESKVNSDIDIRLAEASTLRDQGQFDEAIAIYLSILEIAPNHRQTRQDLALTYAYSKDFERSIELYEQLVQETPDDLELQRRLAEVYSWQGDFAASITVYEAILAVQPDDITVQLALAETLSWARRYDESIAAYDRVLEFDSSNPDVWSARPQVAFWGGQTDRAIELYQEAIVQFPENPQLRLELARVYQSRQQMRQAIAVLEPLLDSRNPEALALRDAIRTVESVTQFEVDGIGDQESSFTLSQTVRFRINDSSTRQTVSLGYNTFSQRNFETLGNTTLQVGIEGHINTLRLTGIAGVDLYSSLPATPILGFRASTPLSPSLTFTGDLLYGAYKENVNTLENEITALRVQPSLYWQIDSETGLFLFYGAGFYNDGNIEQQASLSLERQLGSFFVSVFLFYWTYANDPQNGYFAPPSYLLYSGELGLRGNFTDQLNCQVSATLENQLFSDTSELSNTYQAGCGITVSPNLEFNLGYQYSTNELFSSGSGSASQRIEGRMNLLF